MASSARIDELRKKFEENPRRYFAPLANEYRKAGDVEQAIAICRDYLPQQPGHMSGHIVYGQALYEARQFEEANSVFETALTLDPENLIALRHLGDIALITGDADGARTWYGRVLEADPRNEEIQAQLKSLEQSVPAASSAPPAEPGVGQPTPSSAATVVVSSASRPELPKTIERPVAEVPPQPSTVMADSPTAEIVVDAVTSPVSSADVREPDKAGEPGKPAEPTSQPAGSPIESAAGFEPTAASSEGDQVRAKEFPPLELDAPTGGPSTTPQTGSVSMEGLETTSMTPAPTPPPPAAEPPLLDIGELSPLSEEIPPQRTEAPQRAEVSATSERWVASVTPETPATSEPAGATEPPVASGSAVEPEPAPPSAPPAQTAQTAPPEPPPPAAAKSSEPASTSSTPDSGPFVTETMAELYLHQGHRDEAIRVYRALLDLRPGDTRLQEKLASLESVPTAPSSRPEPAPGAPMVLMDAGPTIRDLLRRVALWKPNDIAGPSAAQAPALDQSSWAPSRSDGIQEAAPQHRNGSAPEAAVASIAHTVARDSLAALFGTVSVSPENEKAAATLALAFADVSASEREHAQSISGAPARPAAKDLSLDSVFGGADANAGAAPSSFSFDQFFSQRATAEHSTATGTPSALAPESRDDVAKFTQWLEGLKQR